MATWKVAFQNFCDCGMITILKKVNSKKWNALELSAKKKHKSVKTEQRKSFSKLIQEAGDYKPNTYRGNCNMIAN